MAWPRAPLRTALPVEEFIVGVQPKLRHHQIGLVEAFARPKIGPRRPGKRRATVTVELVGAF